MAAEHPKPLPVPDRWSEPFWTGAAAHQLSFQRCQACGRIAHPPVIICPACLSTEANFDTVRVNGSGTLRTWTVLRQAFLPGFDADVPLLIAEVEMDEAPGVRLIAQLIDGSPADLRIGAAVETFFEDVGAGVALPRFRLVAPDQAGRP